MNTEASLAELLSTAQPGVKVLSVYIDVDSATGLWKEKLYRLERSLDAIAESLQDRGERSQLDQERAAVVDYLTHYKAGGKGLVIFSSRPQGMWWTAGLQVPVENAVRFDALPYTTPLARLLDEHQRYCVALVDNGAARLLLVHLGEIEEIVSLKGQPVKRHRQTEFSPRLEHQHAAKVKAHVAEVVARLETLHAARRFNRIVVGGPGEALSHLEAEMPRHLSALVAGRISAPMYASNHQILREAMGVEEQFERQKELATVDALITRAGKRERAVVGADETLLALHHGDVFELVVAQGLALPGVLCPACGLASATVVRSCPRCSATVERTGDVVEAAMRQAISRERVRIEVVHGEARERLLAVGGIGALLTHAA